MNIIPQETEADVDDLSSKLRRLLKIHEPDDVRVFLFGSWSSYQKSFTDGDVDVFVGTDNYGYDGGEEMLASLSRNRIDVIDKEGNVYEDRTVQLHWGDTEDFLSKVRDWERIEITDEIL